jgi:ankyrin repeat protein
VDIVKLFLDHDALINIPGLDNDTPLHDAVANGRLKVVKLLVARGAVLTARYTISIVLFRTVALIRMRFLFLV